MSAPESDNESHQQPNGQNPADAEDSKNDEESTTEGQIIIDDPLAEVCKFISSSFL